MRASIKNYLDAAKQRREDGEAGFSLIELIVVVAILGILVAIAIPVFSGIQANAKQAAIDSAAANGATVVASAIAAGGTDAEIGAAVTAALTASSANQDYTFESTGSALDLEHICVVATGTGSLADASGHAGSDPACTG